MKKLLFTLLLAAAALPGWAGDKYPDALYAVGDATSFDWGPGNNPATAPVLYKKSDKVYEGFVNFDTTNGMLKFLVTNAYNQGQWGPATDGYSITNTTVTKDYILYTSEGWGDSDKKFLFNLDLGLYLITADLTEGSESFTFKKWDTTSDVYEISTAIQLSTYADCINKSNQSVKANLTADIDMAGVTGWTPIGQDGKDFKGQFNGQGHRIKNLTTSNGYNNQALFGQAVGGAIIENVIIDASCTIRGAKFTAGILGHVWGDGVIVRNCGNEANVTGTDANAAGIVGCSEKKVIIENCYNTGHITGSKESAAICGWMGDGSSTIANCYNIGAITGQDGSNRMYRRTVTATNLYDIDGVQGTSFTNEQLASGELCYTLNGNQSSIIWYQTIGTDAHPVPFSDGGHSQVYANGEMRCDGTAVEGGTLTYSNSSTSTIPDHQNENGWCTVCGTLDANYLTADSEGFYSIGTANDLNWFAQLVNTVNQSAKAKLTADIDYTSKKQGWIGASQGKAFSGTFDGQEHTLTIDIVNTNLGQTGLFAYINAATIKNLIVEGSATSAGNNCVGGLGGRGDGATSYIQNVIVKTNVSFTGTNDNSDATCGGFFASIHGTAELTNCAFLGSITVPTNYQGNGGLVGWAGSGSNNKYTNCLVAPTEYNQTGNSEDFARNNPKVTNCYKVSDNDARLASGELCYMLNGDQTTISWYQNLSGTVDAYPVPFSSHSHVYANGSFNCNGTPKGTIVYGNTDDEHHDSHTPVDGFCTACDAMVSYVAGYMTPAADGYYEIADNKQMRWFAAMIKDYRNANNLTTNDECNAPVNARLTADIDFTGIKDFEPIGGLWGQSNTRYAGTFDGQHHKITNLVVDLDKDNVGVFGVIAEGAVIKNFTLDSSCSIKGNGHVGIVGQIWRSHNGEVHLECLGNEANITGSGNNVGGILGVNMLNGSYAKLYMKNCYSTGAIKGSGENGQLSGWMGDNAVAENCYAIGEMEHCDGFARFGGGGTVTNCFCDKDLTWSGHPTKVTSEQIASGEVCAKLGFAFRQTIGSGHPCFNQAQGFVAQIGEAGYSTMFNTHSDVEIPTDIEAFVGVITGSGENQNLSLTSLTGNIAKDEPVVLKLKDGVTPGFFNFTPTSGATKSTSNDLVGSNGNADVDKGGDGVYALAQKGDPAKVGFYPVGSSVKIPEGRAYLKITSGGGVKGFTFVFDEDDATGISLMEDGRSQMEDGAIYNLAGQRINKMQRGINIVNGKKILK